MNVTITLTVPEALYASAALKRRAIEVRAMKSGDDWLDETAARLYESVGEKLERALYPEIAESGRKAAATAAAWGYDS